MDKNKIKSFAIWARTNLISAVSDRANRIGVTENKIEDVVVVQGGFKLEGNDEIFKLSKADRDKLVNEVREKGFKQVMEEVAYTWFNRFMGLRYMEVNDYLPTGIRVLSSIVEGKTEPDVLTRVSEVIDELKLNTEYIYELLDSGKTENREEAYKHILVRQCNELGKIVPQMFEKISDYTELLLPENLLEEGSVIRRMVDNIEEEDWKEEVEIIGWLFQYYNTDNNELVYDGSMKQEKIPKELLPAATQIFTPDWVVKYMVQNSLGKVIEGVKNIEDILKGKWEYFIDRDKVNSSNIINIEEIKFLDPAMGSGHILVYAFDMFYEIYQSMGYSEREIPKKILKNNLYGLDIDSRAAQIACFALIMKARQYNSRIFREIEREQLVLNICSIEESNSISNEALEYFINDNEELKEEVIKLINIFIDAKEYGSILKVSNININKIQKRLDEINNKDNFIFADLEKILLNVIPQLIKQTKILCEKYDLIVTNPPYLNSSRMSEKLLNYINNYYQDSKSDFSMIFFEKAICDFCKNNGYIAFVTTTSWMTLKSFEKIRKRMIEDLEFESLIDFGTELFEGKVGHNPIVAWVNKKCKPTKEMCAIKLSEYCYSRRAEKKEQFFNLKNRYYAKQDEFSQIPGVPIAYWASKEIFDSFNQGTSLENNAYAITKGIFTGDNARFLRFWNEVDYESVELKAWNKYSKGGAFRKWYGNSIYVVNWKDDGKELREFKGSGLGASKYYDLPHIVWSKITSSDISFRYEHDYVYFDDASPAIIFSEEIDYTIFGFLNSKANKEIIKIIAPTLNFQIGDIKKIPIIKFDAEDRNCIREIVNMNIKISKSEWDSYEISWDFKVHSLLRLLDKNNQYKLSAVFNIWETECEESFEQLKNNEEELNRIFIDIYGLQDELNPDVDDKDITIRKADRERDIKSFISYAVGCMFGRYSIDAEGLVYAGGDFKDKWDLNDKKVRKIEKDEEGNIISDSWVDTTFTPDNDNVIPITEDEYFEDDIVSRFIDFLRTVYSNETLEENLDFIADSIGRKPSETARQAIRRYFIKDFYKDHLKVYQKRPIYWMFDSGKNDGFKALIYMHRYNEQTVAKVRTDYLHTLQRKYEAEIKRQQLILDSDEYTAKDRTVAKKKIDRILKQIEECREYDQVVAHLANEKISIDLDDGVKVNYAKFQGVKVINSKGKEVDMDLLAKI